MLLIGSPVCIAYSVMQLANEQEFSKVKNQVKQVTNENTQLKSEIKVAQLQLKKEISQRELREKECNEYIEKIRKMQHNLDSLSNNHTKAKKDGVSLTKKLDAVEGKMGKLEAEIKDLERKNKELSKENQAFKEFVKGEVDTEAIGAELEEMTRENEDLRTLVNERERVLSHLSSNKY